MIEKRKSGWNTHLLPGRFFPTSDEVFSRMASVATMDPVLETLFADSKFVTREAKQVALRMLNSPDEIEKEYLAPGTATSHPILLLWNLFYSSSVPLRTKLEALPSESLTRGLSLFANDENMKMTAAALLSRINSIIKETPGGEDLKEELLNKLKNTLLTSISNMLVAADEALKKYQTEDRDLSSYMATDPETNQPQMEDIPA